MDELLFYQMKVGRRVSMETQSTLSHEKDMKSPDGYRTTITGGSGLIGIDFIVIAHELQQHYMQRRQWQWTVELVQMIEKVWEGWKYQFDLKSSYCAISPCLFRTNLELELVHRGGNLCCGGASAAAKRSCLSKYFPPDTRISYSLSTFFMFGWRRCIRAPLRSEKKKKKKEDISMFLII